MEHLNYNPPPRFKDGDTLEQTIKKITNNFHTIEEALESLASSLDGMSPSVFAHLTTSADTVFAGEDVGTYLPLNGIFENAPITGFEVTETPSIKYVGTKTLDFEIDLHAAFSSSANNTTLYVAVKKNGTLVDSSAFPAFAKNLGELYNIPVTTVVELSTDDEVQLVVASDVASTITFTNINTTIRPFKPRL